MPGIHFKNNKHFTTIQAQEVKQHFKCAAYIREGRLFETATTFRTKFYTFET